MLFGIVLALLVLVCIGLIFLIIIQSDKGGGISGAIGGGLQGANTLLGTQDAGNFLTRGTTGFAISYMVLCIILSLFLSKTANKGPVSELAKRAETQQGVTPSDILQSGGLPMQSNEQPAQTPEAIPMPQGAQGAPEGNK